MIMIAGVKEETSELERQSDDKFHCEIPIEPPSESIFIHLLKDC
jgi:hypothetical protein